MVLPRKVVHQVANMKGNHKAVSHKGEVKDYEDQTGKKYKRNSYAK